jgi:glycosyltransferase involved in cell wall biosynthesis
VLEVAPRFPPYVGGVEQHLAEIAPRLMAAGLDVEVLTTDPSKRLPAYDRFHGVPVRRVPVVPFGPDYYLAPAITRVIRKGAPWDVVHVHSYQTLVAPLAMAAARRAGIPFLLTFHSGGHSSAWRNATRGVQVATLGPLIRAARRLVAVSEFELDLFSRRLGIPRDRFVLIPNGAQMPAAVDVTPDPDPLIVSVGRLERYKGHHRVLAAMPHVFAQFPGAKLRIAGQGPYEAALRRQVAKAALSHRVEIGSIPSDDRAGMATLLSRASLVVLMTEYEAHPIAMMEALALKRPTLVAYTSGLMEYADRGYVRAIPVDSDPRAVADAIIQELRDPLVPPPIDVPTWDDCARSLLELYRQIFAEASRTTSGDGGPDGGPAA